MSNLQSTAEEEIIVNTSFTSCLYVQANAFNQHSIFLLDTGSPCSVLSNQIYNKVPKDKNIQRKDDCTKLRAADGSLIETSGKVIVPLHIDGISFNQEFIIAKIHGIDGIIGMDFLCQYDGIIKIKRQILKTSFGNVRLYKQNTNTCARIQVVDTVIIKPHAETFIKTTVEQPCNKNERLSVAEPTKFLLNKGCLMAKTLVNPREEEVIVSILNLSVCLC